MVRELLDSGAVITSNDFEDLALLDLTRHNPANVLLIYLKEQNVNSIDYQILGSNDNSNWESEGAGTIAQDGSAYMIITSPWHYVKVQHKATVPASQGSTSCIVSAR